MSDVKVPKNAEIANKLRSVALVLKMGGNPAGPVDVVESIVAELDAWEEHLAKPRTKVHGGSKREVIRRGR